MRPTIYICSRYSTNSFPCCILSLWMNFICLVLYDFLGVTPSEDRMHGRIRYFVESCARLFNHTRRSTINQLRNQDFFSC